MTLETLVALLKLRQSLRANPGLTPEQVDCAIDLATRSDVPTLSRFATLPEEIRKAVEESRAVASPADLTPELGARFRASLSAPVPRVVIFVHGIFSTAAACFSEMHAEFAKELSWWPVLYDYNFHAALVENGNRLADRLVELGGCAVTLICHSMGGLVGRLAILSGRATCVVRIVMLGTPNFGAVRTAQLGLLAQLAVPTAGLVYGVFRKPGLMDLTRVSTVFKEPIEKGEANADDVEYVTIPGCYFNEARRVWAIGRWGEWQAWTAIFAGLNVGSQFLDAVLPLWKVGLEKPHDGIVEQRSNTFLGPGAGRDSEKKGTLNNAKHFGYTYVHVEPKVSQDLTHVLLQHDKQIIQLVLVLAQSATLAAWYNGLGKDQWRQLENVSPKP